MAYRREVPVLLLAILALIIIVQYFFKIPELKTAASDMMVWAVVLVAFALLLGVVISIMANISYVRRRTPGRWYYSVITLIMAAITIILGLVWSPSHPSYQWLFNNIILVLWTTMISTTGFFLTSAAYRAFRARTWEATALLATGVLVVLRNTPVAISAFAGFTTIGNWIMDVPVTGGMRGLTISAAIGAIAVGLRTILGRERASIGG